MSSSKEYLVFILEQLREISVITFRPMMGEFLLYKDGILFGGIYDDRFLIKITKSNEKYNLPKEIPYENAKPMYIVENIDDMTYLADLVTTTCSDLSKQKKT